MVIIRNSTGEIGGDFEKLPEACVSHVLSLTTPRDSCRSAAVSAAFRSAVDSDMVWERFLPPDHREILDRAVAIAPWSSKRELYFRLCDPILIDGGKMSFNLEKSTGAKCYMISSKELTIIWGNTPHYWDWVPVADLGFDARFPVVARLLNVCWLEIRGKMKTRTLSPNTNYAAYLVFRLQRSRGLSAPAQEASVWIGPHESKHNVLLNPDSYQRLQGRQGEAPQDVRGHFEGSWLPSTRIDGWLEIEMGEFFCGDDDDDDVHFRLMEIKGGHWKRGLIVLGIEVRPKK